MMDIKLKIFINENLDLINENTKESWEEIYNKIPQMIIGEFTKTILDSKINDPASILGYIPKNYLYTSYIQEYEIPNIVTSIGSSAFCGCSLTSVKIPDHVISIGEDAFDSCKALTNVIIGDSVTHIYGHAFNHCSSLTSVVIPNSITYIDGYTFYNCTKLKEIKFKGTKKEAIQCGIGNISEKKWREGSAIEKIICNDEEIIL